MIAFRRRGFESDAMIAEVLRRAARSPGVVWGRHLPPSEALHAAKLEATRTVYVISEGKMGETVTSELVQSLQQVAADTR